mgnify:CR=1 FL=1
MTNIPTDLLRTLIAVVDLRSFTKAAASLGITQPAVSAQIKRLQFLLGGELFDRSAQGIILSRRPDSLPQAFVLRRIASALADDGDLKGSRAQFQQALDLFGKHAPNARATADATPAPNPPFEIICMSISIGKTMETPASASVSRRLTK